ncbi:MAG: hypothetical protein OXM57_14405 [bacterium]|nr:hypothetical protein [bacterium]MDE0601381.1 hypothetical protein [bacterium]
MPGIEEEFQDAIEMGRENQKFISMGKAWCTNIRVDRGIWGVGMVEQATGLPVSGGSFACDFARNPGGMSAMRLASSALAFYEDNCRGCEHRSPGGRVPNLGTWAEGLIADRERREAAQAEEDRVAAQEQQRRISQRQAVSASLDAAAQEVVALVNRLDTDPSDEEAAEMLRTTARLAPDSFPDELKDQFYIDAPLLKLPILVEVLLELDSQASPPELRFLCLTAVRDRWAITEGCGYFSEHATINDVAEDLVEVAVFHAVPSGFPLEDVPGEPGALLRFHSLAPEVVEAKIASLLRHGESRNRAVGAVAAQALFSADPTAGDRLLSALLDGLRFDEGIWDEHHPARKTSMAVSEVFRNNPTATEAAIQARWVHATPSYRARLLDIYTQFVYSQEDNLPANAVQLVYSRVISALQEPMVRGADLRDDFQFMAAELVGRAVSKSPRVLPSLESLLGLWLVWMARRDDIESVEPEDYFGALELMGDQTRVGSLVHRLSEAIVKVASDDPDGFLTVCEDVYRETETTSLVRAQVVRMVGRLVSRSSEHVGKALPLVYTAMLGDEQVIRAAGMEAAGQVMRGLRPESIPPLLATAVAAGLTDQYLIVVETAVGAIQVLPADLVSYREVLNLVVIAFSYASDRQREKLVRSALMGALRIANHYQQHLASVRKKALLVIDAMPPASAREMLLMVPSLMQEDNWVPSAINALRTDDDPNCEYRSEDKRDRLLVRLAQKRLSENQIESLMRSDFATRPADPHRSLVAADFFAEIHRPDLSTQIVRSALQEMPDTIEQRFTRRQLSLCQCVFELEVAIAASDSRSRSHLVDKAKELCSEDE